MAFGKIELAEWLAEREPDYPFIFAGSCRLSKMSVT